MNSGRVHPELRKVFDKLPPVPMHNRLWLFLADLLFRFIPRRKPVDGVTLTDQSLGKIGMRIYRPEGKLSGAGLLWIHGGGLITGSVDTNDNECSRYARDLELVVVSVDYRLAPKHTFPCAIDDCFDVWRWMQQSGPSLGVDPHRISLAGQSAGGGLAASLAQRIYDEGGVQPAAQVLIYPMLDDRTAANTGLDKLKHRLWDNKNNRAGWSWYLGQPAGAETQPEYAVPARREDLCGLPPAWIGVGDIDLFYREDCDYAARLKASGVICQLDVVPQAPHGFEVLVPKASISRDFVEGQYRFLRESLTL